MNAITYTSTPHTIYIALFPTNYMSIINFTYIFQTMIVIWWWSPEKTQPHRAGNQKNNQSYLLTHFFYWNFSMLSHMLVYLTSINEYPSTCIINLGCTNTMLLRPITKFVSCIGPWTISYWLVEHAILGLYTNRCRFINDKTKQIHISWIFYLNALWKRCVFVVASSMSIQASLATTRGK